LGGPKERSGWKKSIDLSEEIAPNAKEADVVDPIDVEEFFCDFEAAAPPGKVGLAHCIPLKEESPKLAPGLFSHQEGRLRRIEIKEGSFGPDIGAVGTDENGYVAEERGLGGFSGSRRGRLSYVRCESQREFARTDVC